MASPKPSTSADSVVVVEDPVDVELAKQSGRIQRKKEAGSTMKMELLPIEVSGKIQMRVWIWLNSKWESKSKFNGKNWVVASHLKIDSEIRDLQWKGNPDQCSFSFSFSLSLFSLYVFFVVSPTMTATSPRTKSSTCRSTRTFASFKTDNAPLGSLLSGTWWPTWWRSWSTRPGRSRWAVARSSTSRTSPSPSSSSASRIVWWTTWSLRPVMWWTRSWRRGGRRGSRGSGTCTAGTRCTRMCPWESRPWFRASTSHLSRGTQRELSWICRIRMRGWWRNWQPSLGSRGYVSLAFVVIMMGAQIILVV